MQKEKNPVNVAKGWKGNALSEKAKNQQLQKIITSLKNLPLKNRMNEEEYNKLITSKVDISNEAQQQNEIEGYQILRKIFIDNWKHNENENPHSYSFTKETYELAHLMKSYSEKLYELIYKSFYLPHPTSVEEYFSKPLKDKKEELIDISNIARNIQNYRNKNNLLDKQEEVCLSIDACSFDRLSNKCKKYAFVYYLQPLNPVYKCVPIYFHPEKNGKAKDIIIEIALKISEVLTENNFKVVAIAVDGDNSYDKKATEVFEIYRKVLEEGGPNVLEKALEKLHLFDGIFWITDPLHVLKCARTRLLSNRICTNYKDLNHCFTVRDIAPILKVGKALSDLSVTGKMRDIYTKQLFNMTNLMKLVNEGESGASVFFLPYSCWAESLFNESIDIISRIYLLTVSFHSFYRFLYQIPNSDLLYNRNFQDASALTFAEKNIIIRCLNTILIQIYYLKKCISLNRSIGIDRLGSHCLENFFGNVRCLCRGFDSYENIISHIAHLQISNDFLYSINMINRNKKRMNEGGARIFPSIDSTRARISIYYHPIDLAEILLNYADIPFSNCIGDRDGFTNEEIEGALDLISLWWCQIPKKKYSKNQSDVSSIRIPSRCIAMSKAGKSAGLINQDEAKEVQKLFNEIKNQDSDEICFNTNAGFNSQLQSVTYQLSNENPDQRMHFLGGIIDPSYLNYNQTYSCWTQLWQPQLYTLACVNPYAINQIIMRTI